MVTIKEAYIGKTLTVGVINQDGKDEQLSTVTKVSLVGRVYVLETARHNTFTYPDTVELSISHNK